MRVCGGLGLHFCPSNREIQSFFETKWGSWYHIILLQRGRGLLSINNVNYVGGGGVITDMWPTFFHPPPSFYFFANKKRCYVISRSRKPSECLTPISPREQRCSIVFPSLFWSTLIRFSPPPPAIYIYIYMYYVELHLRFQKTDKISIWIIKDLLRFILIRNQK